MSDDRLDMKEGSSLSLLCKTSGIPKPRVIWTRDDSKSFSPLIGGGFHYDASDVSMTSVHLVLCPVCVNIKCSSVCDHCVFCHHSKEWYHLGC